MNEFTTVASDEAVAIARILANDHVADIVEALNREPRETATELLCEVTFERLVEIFDQPELDGAPELMEALPRAKAGKLLTAMSVDRAADILRELDEPARSELLGGLAPPLRATLLSILGYPEGSAASIMTTEFVSVPSDWSVGQTLDYIRKVERTRETVYAIYIVDPQTHLLVRSTGLRRLITGEPDDSIMTVAPDHLPVTVGPLTDRETLAQTISKYDLLAVPVVDHGKILGIVTIDDIIDTMIAETTEDVHRFGGMEALDEPYMKMSFLAMIRKRGGWLCALFISEMLTANAM
ncbi:magnesium transporter, partial [Mesorhizobium sp. M7A.F.Ca.CA.001.04.1.1]